MIKQLFDFTLDNNYTGTSKLVWVLPKSMLTIPSELQEVNKYKFNYNGTDYTCTKVSEGETKYFFTYTPEGSTVSAIEIQYFKNEDKLELSVRNNLIDFAVGNVVKLLEEVDEPAPPTPSDDEKIDYTYETDLKSTTTFNRYAIVETEVTMKKPDDLAANYVAASAKVKVNGVEVSSGGGYPEPTGTIEITENGVANVKDYAEANVNVSVPEPTGTIEITENGTVDVKDYAVANVNVQSYPEPTGTIDITENGTIDVKDYAEANVNIPGMKLKIVATNQNTSSFKVLDPNTGTFVGNYTEANIVPAVTDGYVISEYEVGSIISMSEIDDTLKTISENTGTTKQKINISFNPSLLGNGGSYVYNVSDRIIYPYRDYLVLLIKVKDA